MKNTIFKGFATALATPMTSTGVDYDALARLIDFQLENGIPYIKLGDEEGNLKWYKSDTTKEDDLQARIRSVKKESYFYAAMGVVFFVWALLQKLITGEFDDVFMVPMMGIFCFTCCGMQLVRLKNELEAMGRKFTWKI
mgnify:CR=1 FL=1